MVMKNCYNLKGLKKELNFIILLLNSVFAFAQQPGKIDAIYSGVPWFDQNGNIVSAHGANII